MGSVSEDVKNVEEVTENEGAETKVNREVEIDEGIGEEFKEDNLPKMKAFTDDLEALAEKHKVFISGCFCMLEGVKVEEEENSSISEIAGGVFRIIPKDKSVIESIPNRALNSICSRIEGKLIKKIISNPATLLASLKQLDW